MIQRICNWAARRSYEYQNALEMQQHYRKTISALASALLKLDDEALTQHITVEVSETGNPRYPYQHCVTFFGLKINILWHAAQTDPFCYTGIVRQWLDSRAGMGAQP